MHLSALFESLARRRIALVRELNTGAQGSRRQEIHEALTRIGLALGERSLDDGAVTSGDDAVDIVERKLDAGEELTGEEIERILDAETRKGRHGG